MNGVDRIYYIDSHKCVYTIKGMRPMTRYGFDNDLMNDMNYSRMA